MVDTFTNRVLENSSFAKYKLSNVYTSALPNLGSYSGNTAIEILAAAGSDGTHPVITLKTDNNRELKEGKIIQIAYDCEEVKENFPIRIDLTFEEFLKKGRPLTFKRMIWDETRAHLSEEGIICPL